MFLGLEHASESWDILTKHKLLVPTPKVSDSVALGWGLNFQVMLCYWSGDHILRATDLEHSLIYNTITYVLALFP